MDEEYKMQDAILGRTTKEKDFKSFRAIVLLGKK